MTRASANTLFTDRSRTCGRPTPEPAGGVVGHLHPADGRLRPRGRPRQLRRHDDSHCLRLGADCTSPMSKVSIHSFKDHGSRHLGTSPFLGEVHPSSLKHQHVLGLSPQSPRFSPCGLGVAVYQAIGKPAFELRSGRLCSSESPTPWRVAGMLCGGRGCILGRQAWLRWIALEVSEAPRSFPDCKLTTSCPARCAPVTGIGAFHCSYRLNGCPCRNGVIGSRASVSANSDSRSKNPRNSEPRLKRSCDIPLSGGSRPSRTRICPGRTLQFSYFVCVLLLGVPTRPI